MFVIVAKDDFGHYIAATRTVYLNYSDAHTYMVTIAASRDAKIIPTHEYLTAVSGWRKYGYA